MYLDTCFRELAQPLPPLRPIDNQLRLVSGELARRLLVLPSVDTRPGMCTASAFLKDITQGLHAYSSELAQQLLVSPRARGNSRQKFVASHPCCAAGELRLHEQTVRMSVHGVRTDSPHALMHGPTQE